MLRLIFALILVLLMVTPSLAQQSLVGTWKIVSVQREIDGKPEPIKNPRGYLIITPKAFVLAQMEGTRKYGESAADKAALWESMAVLGGSYRVEGNKLVMNPDIHSNESFVGTPQPRFWEIKGNRLLLLSDPRPFGRDPSKQVVLRQELERID